MKINGWLLNVLLGLFTTYACFGQAPPPNDNFTNSIALTGTDVIFSGTLAGATIEEGDPGDILHFREIYAYFDTGYNLPQPTQSVWWSWTAPTSTVLTLQIVSSSRGYPPFELPYGDPDFGDLNYDGLCVYTATNGATSVSDLMLPAQGVKLLAFQSPQTLSIPVLAGTNYQIQLIGFSSANYTIRLVATNAPVITVQPRSQTVYSNASALFYVMAAGLPGQTINIYGDRVTPFTFQWLFNGTNLSGETAPMLALTNIDGSMAGSYSVIVSNSAGYTISQPATLSVSQSNVPISLAVMGVCSNNFMFSLSGENGRNYRIESSTDLVHWAPEKSFPIAPVLANSTSVVFNSNSPLIMTLTNILPRKFFRATPYVINDPEAEVCINNLRQIRIAKILWMRDNDVSFPYFTPQSSDLLPYFPHQLAPFCPEDWTHQFLTSYTIADLVVEPICNISGFGNGNTHVLEDPQ